MEGDAREGLAVGRLKKTGLRRKQMTTWQCSGCGRVWREENPPAECGCGCRLIRESVGSGSGPYREETTSCSSSAIHSNRMWVVLCCAGALALTIIGGIVLRQKQHADRARLETAVRLSEQRAREAEAASAEAARRAEEADQAREREENIRTAAKKKEEEKSSRKKKGLVIEGYEDIEKRVQENKEELLRDTVIEMMRQEGFRVFPEQEVQRRIDAIKKNEKQGKGSRPKFA
jgi:hypothetical protein